MCWPWPKLNNLVKSLKEFKTLSTVPHCSSSLGKVNYLKVYFKRVYLGTESAMNACYFTANFVKCSTFPCLSQLLASRILKECFFFFFFSFCLRQLLRDKPRGLIRIFGLQTVGTYLLYVKI